MVTANGTQSITAWYELGANWGIVTIPLEAFVYPLSSSRVSAHMRQARFLEREQKFSGSSRDRNSAPENAKREADTFSVD